MPTTFLGMPLADFLQVVVAALLLLITGMYVWFTARLWRTSQQQRNDSVRAQLVPRLVVGAGGNVNVEVVNAGPGIATQIVIELGYLAGESQVERVVLPLAALLVGETRKFVPPRIEDGDVTAVDVRVAWTDPAGASAIEPHAPFDFREAVEALGDARVVTEGEGRRSWLDATTEFRLRQLAMSVIRDSKTEQAWWGGMRGMTEEYDAESWGRDRAYQIRRQGRRLRALARELWSQSRRAP